MDGRWVTLVLAALLGTSTPAGSRDLVAVKVEEAPVVDGIGDEALWQRTAGITTIDTVAEIKVTLKAVYTDEAIFFLVTYPDPTENREHKTMRWDAEEQGYRMGPKREDMFVFKWSMEPQPADLSLSADRPYKADIWFWKAYRTDPAGYADDKMQVYSITPLAQAKRVFSRSGKLFHLFRPGDAGSPAYELLIYDHYAGDTVPRYRPVEPAGSRADIRARGRWHAGTWTIEFGRRLATGHADDVQFDPGKCYLFGVSRYEIAGRQRDPAVDQPEYGMGDTAEALTLSFERSPPEP